MTEPPQDPLPSDHQTADLDESGAEPASPVSADSATNTADPAQKPILATIVSEASKSLSGKIFLSAWFATLAVAVIIFSLSYLKASNWLNRGKEVSKDRNAQTQPSCVQRHFQGMLSSFPGSDPGNAVNAKESLESLRREAIAQRQEKNANRLELVIRRNTLQTELQNQQAAAPSQSSADDSSSPATAGAGSSLERISQLQRQLEAVEQDLSQEDKALDMLDKSLRGLGIPRISIAEVTRLNEQNQAIQKRIYVHYDITRTFYATHQAGSVGAALALLFGSIVLIFITGDIWEGKIKNNPGLVFPLILFGSTYILFLHLPTVLSAEEIYQANLTQYIGYVNLEEEICTVLATERFVDDPDQPGTIQEIQFNRLIHSVEQRMRALNTRTISSDVRAIDRLRLDLDALSYPRKSEEEAQ